MKEHQTKGFYNDHINNEESTEYANGDTISYYVSNLIDLKRDKKLGWILVAGADLPRDTCICVDRHLYSCFDAGNMH